MHLNVYGKKLIQKPWIILYRRLKRYCNNPESFLFFEYGAKGIKFEFTSSIEIKHIWDRDGAANMSEPCFCRKNDKGNFNLKNCYFAEWIDEIIKIARRAKEKGVNLNGND